ncbi:MAG: hypothetical protein ABMA64_27950, partial [Myxococcota bacterium]
PEPVPVPVEIKYGQVEAPSDVAISLVGSDGQRHTPGRVPAGRYELWADFGSGRNNMNHWVDVVPGGTSVVHCNRLLYTCDVDR